jgi:hypothetical protein
MLSLTANFLHVTASDENRTGKLSHVFVETLKVTPGLCRRVDAGRGMYIRIEAAGLDIKGLESRAVGFEQRI